MDMLIWRSAAGTDNAISSSNEVAALAEADALAALLEAVAAVELLRLRCSPPATTPTPASPKMLTVDQVAEATEYAPSYVYELIRRRVLPAVRVGKYVRVTEHDLAAFVELHHDEQHGDRDGVQHHQGKGGQHRQDQGRDSRAGTPRRSRR